MRWVHGRSAMAIYDAPIEIGTCRRPGGAT
jgi:hypothetical protein